MIAKGTNFIIIIFFLAFCFYAIFVGLDYLDSGFIISISNKLNKGAIIYKDFDYVRPFGTPIFWDIMLKPFYGFDKNLFIICRTIVLLQFLAISYNILRIIYNEDFWKKEMWLGLIALTTLGSNNFPLMPWHTIDGIFFLSFALYYFHKKNALLSIFFSLLSATTKQSFYFAAILFILLILLYRKQFNFKFNLKILIFIVISIFTLIIYKIPEAIFFFKNNQQTTDFNKFFGVAFRAYSDSFHYFFPFVISFALSLIFWFWKKKNNFWEVFFASIIALSVFIPIFWWFFDFFIHEKKHEDYNLLLSLNGLVPLLLLSLLIIFIKEKNHKLQLFFIPFLGVFIAWCSSISWGANNIFLALPFLVLSIDSKNFFFKKSIVFTLVIGMFLLRILNPYFEKNIFETTFSKTENLPIYSGIFTSKNNLEFFQESQKISEKYRDFIFLPEFPAASIMYAEHPNRAPWEMDVEYPNYKKDLSLLKNNDIYFIVEKQSARNQPANDFYKSSFKEATIKETKIVDSTKHFYIYRKWQNF